MRETLSNRLNIGCASPADDCELTETAWLLRPTLAQELLPAPEPAEAGGGTTSTSTTTGEDLKRPGGSDDGSLGPARQPRIVDGERRLDAVRIKMRIPWEHWQDIYNEVIEPLAREGAEILVDVNILAQSDGAIRENVVELGIKESLSQRGIDAEVESR